MMQFELLRDSIENLLTANADGNFRVIGEQKQSTAAAQVKDNLRTVQVYYASGEFPAQGATSSDLVHDATFVIEYTVAMPAKGDVSKLNDESATAAELTAALSNIQEGSRLADRAIDELKRLVTYIIMKPQNRNLGITGEKYAPRLDQFKKTEPINKGSNLIVLRATETLTIKLSERMPTGVLTPAVQPVVDVDIREIPLNDIIYNVLTRTYPQQLLAWYDSLGPVGISDSVESDKIINEKAAAWYKILEPLGISTKQ